MAFHLKNNIFATRVMVGGRDRKEGMSQACKDGSCIEKSHMQNFTFNYLSLYI